MISVKVVGNKEPDTVTIEAEVFFASDGLEKWEITLTKRSGKWAVTSSRLTSVA